MNGLDLFVGVNKMVFAEGQAMRRLPMHMADWIAKLHAFLTINDRDILTHAGKISHQMAKELAEAECDKFNRQRVRQADVAGGEFEKASRHLPPAAKRKKGGEK
jgi:hypothetical protein